MFNNTLTVVFFLWYKCRCKRLRKLLFKLQKYLLKQRFCVSIIIMKSIRRNINFCPNNIIHLVDSIYKQLGMTQTLHTYIKKCYAFKTSNLHQRVLYTSNFTSIRSIYISANYCLHTELLWTKNAFSPFLSFFLFFQD